ncbi:MAG: hypothetical protein IJ002_05425 [Clostridia bacterium]|nr:hypothetical protein [Clostridia bacterium]
MLPKPAAKRQISPTLRVDFIRPQADFTNPEGIYFTVSICTQMLTTQSRPMRVKCRFDGELQNGRRQNPRIAAVHMSHPAETTGSTLF